MTRTLALTLLLALASAPAFAQGIYTQGQVGDNYGRVPIWWNSSITSKEPMGEITATGKYLWCGKEVSRARFEQNVGRWYIAGRSPEMCK